MTNLSFQESRLLCRDIIRWFADRFGIGVLSLVCLCSCSHDEPQSFEREYPQQQYLVVWGEGANVNAARENGRIELAKRIDSRILVLRRERVEVQETKLARISRRYLTSITEVETEFDLGGLIKPIDSSATKTSQGIKLALVLSKQAFRRAYSGKLQRAEDRFALAQSKLQRHLASDQVLEACNLVDEYHRAFQSFENLALQWLAVTKGWPAAFRDADRDYMQILVQITDKLPSSLLALEVRSPADVGSALFQSIAKAMPQEFPQPVAMNKCDSGFRLLVEPSITCEVGMLGHQCTMVGQYSLGRCGRDIKFAKGNLAKVIGVHPSDEVRARERMLQRIEEDSPVALEKVSLEAFLTCSKTIYRGDKS